ncbi:MAG: ThuA domain-containing protein [Hyphomonadaceae bacterium]|nr:ThuA domain-containing protein [Hyphomonadaceae bacterium]
MEKKRINAVLIAGGKFHDIDFARLEILKLLAEDERVRVRVFEDYANIAAIQASDFLITYTCDVMPSLEAQEALKAYVEGGKRWYALHGTNSILRFLSPEGAGYGQLLVDAPRWAPLFMQTLGSQFVAHPPIAPFKVLVTQPNHPLVQGVAPFETDDELYLMETHGDLDVMLHCQFGGEANGFVEKDWAQADHPVFYIHRIGKGEVLYLTLGHCRGHYDMPGIADYYPQVERCAWNLPVFYDLLRRGIAHVKAPVG